MSERIGNRCTFPKIVGDDVFIIAEYDKEAYGSLRFITSPFHVSNAGIITKIKPDPARTDSIFIASDNPYQQQVPYTLAYWEQEQQCFKNGYFPTDTIPGGILIRKIPKGSLLKAMISRPEKAAEDRIFLVENDTVKDINHERAVETRRIYPTRDTFAKRPFRRIGNAIHTLGDRENLLDSTNRPVLIRRVPTRFVVESKQGAVPMDLRGYPPPFPLGAYPPLLSLLHTPGAGKAPVYRTNGCLVVSASAGVP